MLADGDGVFALSLSLPRQGVAAQGASEHAPGESLGWLGRHLGDQQGGHLLDQGRGIGVLAQTQQAIGGKAPVLTAGTPAVGAPQSDLAAIAVEGSRDPAFFLPQRVLAVRALLIGRVGFDLHGFLNQRPLQFQGALTDGFLDEPQPLLGMRLDAPQARLEILPPTGDVQIEQIVVVLGQQLIDEIVDRFKAGAIFRAVNRHRRVLGLLDGEGSEAESSKNVLGQAPRTCRFMPARRRESPASADRPRLVWAAPGFG
jgi:hypothetical protein